MKDISENLQLDLNFRRAFEKKDDEILKELPKQEQKSNDELISNMNAKRIVLTQKLYNKKKITKEEYDILMGNETSNSVPPKNPSDQIFPIKLQFPDFGATFRLYDADETTTNFTLFQPLRDDCTISNFEQNQLLLATTSKVETKKPNAFEYYFEQNFINGKLLD
jgi:hypothetical protein